MDFALCSVVGMGRNAMPSAPREDATVKIRVRNVTRLAVGIAVVLGLMASPAAALPVTDLASVALGGSVGYFSDMVWDPVEGNHGTLATRAYVSSGGYVYVATLDPIVSGVKFFQTTFLNTGGVAGFTGLAGWSFSDAVAAGSATGGGAFTLGYKGDGSTDLLWTVRNAVDGFTVANWDNQAPIRFFFESTYAPGLNDYYEMMNAVAGFAQGLAPDPNAPPATVPEPGTLLLLVSGLLAGGAWTRRVRRQTT